MSGIAELLHNLAFEISGSDLIENMKMSKRFKNWFKNSYRSSSK